MSQQGRVINEGWHKLIATVVQCGAGRRGGQQLSRISYRKIQNEISKNQNGKWKAKENNKSGMKRERERQAGREGLEKERER